MESVTVLALFAALVGMLLMLTSVTRNGGVFVAQLCFGVALVVGGGLIAVA